MLAETFLIAWRKLDSLPLGDEARLWLFGVSRNLLRQGTNRERVLDTVVRRLADDRRVVIQMQHDTDIPGFGVVAGAARTRYEASSVPRPIAR